MPVTHRPGDSQSLAQAFSQGSDARLNGLPLTAIPYHGASQDNPAWYWKRGWFDVHYFFGLNAKRPVRELPALETVATAS